MSRPMPGAGDCLFGSDDTPINAKVEAFWSWALGDLCDDDVKGWFAEWMVAKLLSIPSARRISWANSDLITPEGVRIEIKSTSYWQSWKLVDEYGQPRPRPTHKLPQDRAIGFGGLQARDARTTSCQSDPVTYKSDLYVFAFQHEKDESRWNALDLAQWEFYILAVEDVCTIPTKRIGLAALRAKQNPLTAIAFARLGREMISAVATRRRTAEMSRHLADPQKILTVYPTE